MDTKPHQALLSSLITAMNASCGAFTFPMAFIRFYPFACFCSSFFFRLSWYSMEAYPCVL